MSDVTWQCKHFDELTPHELYAIMKLRIEVFIVEQNCIYQDADNNDPRCFHLTGFAGSMLAAYARLVPAGVTFTNISIGRVIISPVFRRTGLGKTLLQKAIDESYRLFGKKPIKLGAQLYLKTFYEGFGFEPISETYLEDNIPHISMLKK